EALVDGHRAPGGVAVGGGKLFRQPAAEAVDEAGGLHRRDRGRTAADEAEPGVAAVTALLVVERERPKGVDPAQVAPVAETLGQHADDGERLAVDAHRAAEDRRVATETFLPVAVAEHEHAVA